MINREYEAQDTGHLDPRTEQFPLYTSHTHAVHCTTLTGIRPSVSGDFLEKEEVNVGRY